MYPRRLILANSSYSHVFFRCHDRKFFLKPPVIKNFLLYLLSKYKRKHGIKIYEFNIMDNHVHLLIHSDSTEQLGNFMRTVNSQLARRINQHFKRDSQAIRERYKSPMVSRGVYLSNLMNYIWLNKYKVEKSKIPQKDPYCSLSWRLGNILPGSLFHTNEERKLVNRLLDPIDDLPIEKPLNRKIDKSFLVKMISGAMERTSQLLEKVFECSHTIGDSEAVKYRGELLSAFSHPTPIINFCY